MPTTSTKPKSVWKPIPHGSPSSSCLACRVARSINWRAGPSSWKCLGRSAQVDRAFCLLLRRDEAVSRLCILLCHPLLFYFRSVSKYILLLLLFPSPAPSHSILFVVWLVVSEGVGTSQSTSILSSCNVFCFSFGLVKYNMLSPEFVDPHLLLAAFA